MNKCNELEKEIAEAQENHARDAEEWKKFQADLQTAVRVANDFMNGDDEYLLFYPLEIFYMVFNVSLSYMFFFFQRPKRK